MAPKGHTSNNRYSITESHMVLDSHECGGAKAKGVEGRVGVEADSVNSMS